MDGRIFFLPYASATAIQFFAAFCPKRGMTIFKGGNKVLKAFKVGHTGKEALVCRIFHFVNILVVLTF